MATEYMIQYCLHVLIDILTIRARLQKMASAVKLGYKDTGSAIYKAKVLTNAAT